MVLRPSQGSKSPWRAQESAEEPGPLNICVISVGGQTYALVIDMCAGAPLAEGLYRPLTEPVEGWHFNMRCLLGREAEEGGPSTFA